MKNSDLIPHSRPAIGQEEIEAVRAVLQSGQIAEGKKTAEFERTMAKRFGAKHAAAVNSGTSALHLALIAIGVGHGDDVILPGYVCTAVLNAVKYAGANPVLAEIDPETLNIDPADVRKRLTPKTKAVIAPHMFGLPARMDDLLYMNVPVIEDCAQSMGGMTEGGRVGMLGRAAVFSFYATKVIAAGEGGMVLTNSNDLAEKIRDLKDYDNREDYQVRYNYKMTDIAAAMGLCQLSRLAGFIARRREIARRYFTAFANLDFNLPPQNPDHIYFRFVIQAKKKGYQWVQRLKEKGVVAEKPVFKTLQQYLSISGYPITEHAWKHAVSIPVYPALSDSQVDRIIEAVKDVHDALVS